MNEEFDIHAALRLESLRLSMLLEASAVKRETDLHALLRAAAARGGAMSGGTLQQEVEIIFAATETMVDTVIAYRKELAARAPDLLLAYPYLKEFHTKPTNWPMALLSPFKSGALETPRLDSSQPRPLALYWL